MVGTCRHVELNAENFEREVLQSELPVLVDFWAAWCPPCRVLGPIVEDLAREYDGRVKVAKLDVDQAADLAAAYGIQSIPTLLLFRNGAVVDRVIGAVPRKRIIDRLARL